MDYGRLPALPALPDDKLLFRPGDVVGDVYEIGELLGEGGMGQVFDAFDRNLRRRVAVKANWPEASRSVRVEAQALAAVRHPGLVVVHALGTHGGVDFLVMEHVAGVTLEGHLAKLERMGMPLVERLDILLAVADALAAVHRAGLSHGDVKPSNVIMAPSGRVVLLDLGLVRPLYQADDGRVTGTPAYMAPEIVSPRFEYAGWPLVDAYAFGVLAYRVLAGDFPFAATSDLDMVLAHAEQPPKPLVVTSAGSDLVPARLGELVLALLAKEPNDRPAPMDAVVWQLRAVRDDVARRRVRRRGRGQLAAASVPEAEGPSVPSPIAVEGLASSSAASAPVSVDEGEGEGEGSGPLEVLVVDDDDAIGKLVALYVKQVAKDAIVRVVPDAEAALAILRDASPDLVFLDLMMPRMNGFELFTYLRGVGLVDASRVVAMSAGGTMDDIQLILELGAHDFIPKDGKLRERVQSVVRAVAR
jgi:serine/threonine-protein kinase